MLLRFVVSNFMSFSEEFEFNMFAGSYRRQKEHVYKTGDIDLLKSAAIYGANGSGKSNFVKALHSLQDIVVNNKNAYAKISPFKLDKKYQDKPSSFEIDFQYGTAYYSYGIEILDAAISKEWLYQLDVQKEEDEMIFEREMNEGKIELRLHEKYLQTEKDKLLIQIYAEDILAHDIPFVHLVRDKKFKEITDAFKWFDEKLHLAYPDSKYASFMWEFVTNTKFKKFVSNIFSTLGTGVVSLNTQTTPIDVFFGDENTKTKKKVIHLLDKGKQFVTIEVGENIFIGTKDDDNNYIVHELITQHQDNNGELLNFELGEESDGTQRLIDLIPALEVLTNQDIVLVIDEIGRSLHPSLLKEFLALFLRTKTKGQLIFTTHESNLLDLNLFRQDEIWFLEKDKKGSTKGYSLSDYKPRYDSDIRKGYLNGRFGAIPFLGNLKDLKWEQHG